MKTVKITVGPADGYPHGFDGYPTGKEPARRFETGEVAELSNDYADLLVTKGLAKEVEAPAPAPAKPATQKDITA